MKKIKIIEIFVATSMIVNVLTLSFEEAFEKFNVSFIKCNLKLNHKYYKSLGI